MMEEFQAAGFLTQNCIRDTDLQIIEVDELSLDTGKRR
jgi:hypothetical protein